MGRVRDPRIADSAAALAAEHSKGSVAMLESNPKGGHSCMSAPDPGPAPALIPDPDSDPVPIISMHPM